MQREYWSGVGRRAWLMTADRMRLASAGKIAVAGAVYALATLLLVYFGSMNLAGDSLISIMVWLAATIALALLIFIYYFIKAPAIIDAERATTISALEAAITSHKTQESIMDELGVALHKSLRLIDDYGASPDMVAEADKASSLVAQIDVIATQLSAQQRRLILLDDRSEFNHDKYSHVFDEDWPAITTLALRVPAIKAILSPIQSD